MNRIKEIRTQKNLTQEDVGKILSVKRSVISKYENCAIPLTDDTIKILVSFFDVSSDYLLCLSEIKNPATQSEQPLAQKEIDLLERYRFLNEDGQGEAIKHLDYLLSRAEYKKGDSVPNIGKSVG